MRVYGWSARQSFATRLECLLKMISLQQILGYIPSASTEELQQILTAVQTELPKRDGMNSKYVEHVKDFCQDRQLLDLVWAECESLNLNPKKNKTASQWLSTSKEPYVYNDTTPVHAAKDIKQFSVINKLRSLVNESTEVIGPLDSCLVLQYNSRQSSLTLHSDDELSIDQDKSICSFSLGCERTIEFFEKGARPKLVKDIRMTNNSLVIMRPGTQQNLKHCVRAERNTSSNDTGDSQSQVRYSLSFRAVRKAQVPVGVTSENQGSAPQPPPTQTPLPKKYVSLIAGDSFAARLDTDKLAKGKAVVENIAEGGAKMKNVQKQLEHYAAANPGTEVNKIIVSVGTNDIRNCKDISILRGPLKELCKKIGSLFPRSKVFFQSLLPLPLLDSKDWSTNRRVQDFNRILYNECIYRRYHFIEVFHPFTKFRRQKYEPVCRFDRLFERGGIHPNPERGMGVLARYYIRALHSRFFNPCVFQ